MLAAGREIGKNPTYLELIAEIDRAGRILGIAGDRWGSPGMSRDGDGYLQEAGSHLAGIVVPVGSPAEATFTDGAAASPHCQTRSPLAMT